MFAFLFFVILFLYGMSLIIRYIVRKTKCTDSVIGTIIDFYRKDFDNDSRSTMYYLTFEYIVDGKAYTKTSDIWFPIKKYKISQEVAVFYNPNNPEEYFIEENRVSLFVGIILVGVSLFELREQMKYM